MSEYQYYEFQALDRPLTKEQMVRLRTYSSRARITSSSFINEYHWGDFKGDPDEWLEEYFDAFLHVANWGTRWFMLRLPARLFAEELLNSYCVGESFSWHKKADRVVVSFHTTDEDAEWAEGEGYLASFVPVRSELLHGDHRAL
jgi:hypothetical protein